MSGRRASAWKIAAMCQETRRYPSIPSRWVMTIGECGSWRISSIQMSV